MELVIFIGTFVVGGWVIGNFLFSAWLSGHYNQAELFSHNGELEFIENGCDVPIAAIVIFFPGFLFTKIFG